MRLKSYFTHTVEDAIRAAKVELGDEAMLVDSKRLETANSNAARFEVRFSAAAPPPAVAPSRSARAGAGNWLQVRKELLGLVDQLSQPPAAGVSLRLSPARQELEEVRGQLRRSGLSPEVAEELMQLCRPLLERGVLTSGGSTRRVDDSIELLVAGQWAAPVVSKARIIVLVGPAGAGKSTMAAKLAVQLPLQDGRRTRVISFDNVQVGGGDRLCRLCSLLGIPYHSVDCGPDLLAALEECGPSERVLIDTPGYARIDTVEFEEARLWFAQITGARLHLVVPATWRLPELRAVHAQYSGLGLSAALPTRLDDTEQFGPIWTFVRESGLPVDWASTGPRVPDDWMAGDAVWFARQVLGGAAENRTPAPLRTMAAHA